MSAEAIIESPHHFSIAGEFITAHARELVGEEKFGAAWILLMQCLHGISLDQVADVLSGRRKLTGVNEVELVDDNVSIDTRDYMEAAMKKIDLALKSLKEVSKFRGMAGLCHAAYKPVVRRGVPMRGSPAGLITERVADDLVGGSQFAKVLMAIFPPFSDGEWAAFWTPEMIEKVKEFTPKFGDYDTLKSTVATPKSASDITSLPRYEPSRQRARATLARMDGVPINIDTYLEKAKELEERPCPKPDTTYASDNGWILPNGKFYPCASAMEHIWLAYKLAAKTEQAAEEEGWAKVSKSPTFGDVHIFSKKPPTQKQINTAFDWSRRIEARTSVFEKWLDSWSDEIA